MHRQYGLDSYQCPEKIGLLISLVALSSAKGCDKNDIVCYDVGAGYLSASFCMRLWQRFIFLPKKINKTFLIQIRKENIMKTSNKTNPPSAARLIDSLRHLDYTNEGAIYDIVDNSIDAGASQIWVEVLACTGKEPGEIRVIDNGCGMDEETLDEALRLGSNVEKNPECDLGLYGMGLVTASISIGKRLEVITRNGEGEILQSIQDVDEIKQKNEFVKFLDVADDKAKKLLDDTILGLQKKHTLCDHSGKLVEPSQTGTVVSITILDNCKYHTIKGFADNLRAGIGQTFREFIQSGKINIYINGEIVKAIDPIDDFEPTIMQEGEVAVEAGPIEIRIAELKDYGYQINKQNKINPENQGFYVIRNNREILTGTTLGLYTKHPSLNCLRIEFRYSGVLDKVLGSNFSKSKIVLPQNIGDKIGRFCNPFIKRARANWGKRAQIRKDTKEDFSEIEKYITRKSHLLSTPKAKVEERTGHQDRGKKAKTPDSEHGPRLNITKRKRISLDAVKVKFQERKIGERGPLYETDQERDVIIIRWNTEHPFYTDVVAASSEEKNVFNPLVFLIYSFACAELRSQMDSDSQEIIENIRYEVGRNLAVLMH